MLLSKKAIIALKYTFNILLHAKAVPKKLSCVFALKQSIIIQEPGFKGLFKVVNIEIEI